MGMDVRTLQNYKLLSEMIPELEELIDTGIVTKTTTILVLQYDGMERTKLSFWQFCMIIRT